MDREQQVEKLLEQPYYVIDFLPRHNLRYSDYDKSIYYEKDVIEHKRLFEKDIADRQKELSEFLDRANIRVEWINKCEQEKRYSISGRTYRDGKNKNILLLIRYEDGSLRQERYSYVKISDMRSKLDTLKSKYCGVDWSKFTDEI
ncbi:MULTISPECIES: hypothetical protein [unclassified Lacrimispora]|uniref:hypothetical protein n=1 Tax=unclassified Lacrimispora TaxID=2719232 RepID=UPI00376F56BF